MIQQYCPDGVEYVKLGDVLSVNRGKRLTKMQLSDDGQYYVYHGSKDTPLGKYSQFNVKGNTTIVVNTGGIGGVKFCDDDFWCSDGSFWIGHSDLLNDKYVYYFLSPLETYFASQKRVGGVPTIDRSVVENVEIPLPPLPVQEEIVRILDNFTNLAAELQAELQARQQQYNYYRDNLLSFEGRTDVRWMKLGDVCDLGTGSHNTQDGLSEGQYPFYTRGSEVLYLNDYDYDETAIITAGDGAGVGKVFHFVQGKYALHQRAYRIVPNEKKVLARFVYYYIGATFYNYIMRNSVSSSVVSIRRPMMVNYPIPVPPIKEQEKVISILDRFDTLVNDLSQGLPAEIEARRQQYEYYRDRLLSFKRKEI